MNIIDSIAYELKYNLASVIMVLLTLLLITAFLGSCTYGMVGTKGDIATIKEMAPSAIEERGWDILRYEGWERGSFNKHGGKVWYHVADKKNASIQYRINVTLWDGELHFYYGAPEALQRTNINLNGTLGGTK